MTASIYYVFAVSSEDECVLSLMFKHTLVACFLRRNGVVVVIIH